jgi:O-acetyl-ADP-ribose deacetylase (regulator of RNase III)
MKVSVGNILSVTEGIIIQQVNAQGVMGSGIAKAIRDKWPKVWDEYTVFAGLAYRQPELGARLMGRVLLTEVAPALLVASVVGQQFFRRPGDPEGRRYTSYDALDEAFTYLANALQFLPVSLHFPLIGSDRGGGNWPTVKSIIEHRLDRFDLNLWLLPGVAEPGK